MPRTPHPCAECQQPCRGTYCQKCSVGKPREAYVRKRRYSFPQTPAVVTETVTPPVRDWWEVASPSGFTATAKALVVPNEKQSKAYNWQTVEP